MTETKSGQANSKDISIQRLEALQWDAASIEHSLTAVYGYVMRIGTDAGNWYLKAKRPKQRLAYAFRLWAIIFTALAGVVPIVANIWTDNGVPKIPPSGASILLLVSATLIFLDQFLGCSSGWMRYIKAHMQIKTLLEQLEFAYAIERSSWLGSAPTPEQVQVTLGKLKTVANQISEIVLNETNEWATEFKTALRQIEDSAKQAADKAKPGGINLTVTNGEQCEKGWTLKLNDQSPRTCAGKTTALPEVPPGLWRITVDGVINYSAKRAERAVPVVAGEIVAVEVTLS